MADLIITVGVPGSGKSTLAARIADGQADNPGDAEAVRATGQPFVIVSPDDIRKELTGDVTDQSRNGDVFKAAHQRALEHLRAGRTVVFDATNVTPRSRRPLLDTAALATARPVAWRVALPHAESLARNAARSRVVPGFVMARMVDNFDQHCAVTQLEAEGFVVWTL